MGFKTLPEYGPVPTAGTLPIVEKCLHVTIIPFVLEGITHFYSVCRFRLCHSLAVGVFCRIEPFSFIHVTLSCARTVSVFVATFGVASGVRAVVRPHHLRLENYMESLHGSLRNKHNSALFRMMSCCISLCQLHPLRDAEFLRE